MESRPVKAQGWFRTPSLPRTLIEKSLWRLCLGRPFLSDGIAGCCYDPQPLWRWPNQDRFLQSPAARLDKNDRSTLVAGWRSATLSILKSQKSRLPFLPKCLGRQRERVSSRLVHFAISVSVGSRLPDQPALVLSSRPGPPSIHEWTSCRIYY